MAYAVPEGCTRIFTYIPDELHISLHLLAYSYGRTLGEEFRLAIEAHLGAHAGEIPVIPAKASMPNT